MESEVFPGLVLAVVRVVAEPVMEDELAPGMMTTLRDLGLILPVREGRKIVATQRAEKWVEMLCATPLPVAIWEDPRAAKGTIYSAPAYIAERRE